MRRKVRVEFTVDEELLGARRDQRHARHLVAQWLGVYMNRRIAWRLLPEPKS